MPYLDAILPNRPQRLELIDAFDVLEAAHRAAEAFFATFDSVRANRNAHGAPTDTEQDLLRAAVAFASAGLDAMVKQLIKDSLPNVLRRDVGAMKQFTGFLESRLRKSTSVGDIQMDAKFIAEILVHDCPRPRVAIEQRLVKDLTSNSLQSKDELLRVAAYFAIRPQDITENTQLLSEIFSVRNQIAHEMDIDFTQPNRSRRSRRRTDMVQYAKEILTIASRFLTAVDAKLAQDELAV